ncbi:hypothetical protein T05_6691 [Trichinella murrelli]|uniref:Uncharacterized protein n=1 Tax=Trichinella murrelli TaxID=144512 RepID=A0A0V0SWA3_9BILA|nr:hypothetical protein T05_6691 [Trichinella murrelli]
MSTSLEMDFFHVIVVLPILPMQKSYCEYRLLISINMKKQNAKENLQE